MKTKIFIFFAFLLLSASISSAQKITSVYTDLDSEKCRTLRKGVSDEEGYIGECRGIAGYKLQVLEGDLRQSINVITPKKKKFELNFWHVSSGFSAVGAKAEWRVKRKTPTALIVRFNVSENSENAAITTSYLIISKITANQVCITDVLKPTANQNTQAQTLADEAYLKPCKTFD